MEKESAKTKLKGLLLLFGLFMKIGLFTFGGGYAMISLIRREFIEKRKWITAPEFTDMIAISESTPGPLAVNSATYVGYKIGGFWGALCATVGVVIPSFVIIYVISLFLEQFLQLRAVAAAFKGIQVAVAFLILSAGIKMFREMEKKPVTVATAVLIFAVMILLDVFALSFSSVYLILIGAGVGLAAYFAGRIVKHKKNGRLSADAADGAQSGGADGQTACDGDRSAQDAQEGRTPAPADADGQTACGGEDISVQNAQEDKASAPADTDSGSREEE